MGGAVAAGVQSVGDVLVGDVVDMAGGAVETIDFGFVEVESGDGVAGLDGADGDGEADVALADDDNLVSSQAWVRLVGRSLGITWGSFGGSTVGHRALSKGGLSLNVAWLSCRLAEAKSEWLKVGG